MQMYVMSLFYSVYFCFCLFVTVVVVFIFFVCSTLTGELAGLARTVGPGLLKSCEQLAHVSQYYLEDMRRRHQLSYHL